ncbi:hypothetical protein PHISP_04262 [Aspergillus sp. HF37]|nr:hypothetical protein PHISP_04262 [Aspergillus sp. HF37]
MTTPTLPTVLVARFLRSSNYSQTLDAFIREAGLPADVGQANDKESNWTIEGVLQEKTTFDQSVNFERYTDDDKEKDAWSEPAPSNPTIIQTPTSSNLLASSVERWTRPRDDESRDPESPAASYIAATGADRQLHLFQTAQGNDLAASFSGLTDSPILSYVSVCNGRCLLMTSMSGQLVLQRGSEVMDRRKEHTKYAVKVAVDEDVNEPWKIWAATAGWDAKIFVYCLRHPEREAEGPTRIGEPVASISLPSIPESILFVRHAESGELILLVSRRDSTYLYYYGLDSPSPSPSPSQSPSQSPSECKILGKQNLAPHSNAWVAFSPSCLALSPHDPGLVAVATSTLPHMKVILARLLFPAADSLELDPGNTAATAEPVTQASQAMAALALQNREDAAIHIQANTFAPQTAYSTPQVAWRPDGSGVWVNGDDGVVRGVEARTGKVVALLKDGHAVGCKVRTIWAGWVEAPRGREEWVVSGGFDKRLIVWRV